MSEIVLPFSQKIKHQEKRDWKEEEIFAFRMWRWADVAFKHTGNDSGGSGREQAYVRSCSCLSVMVNLVVPAPSSATCTDQRVFVCILYVRWPALTRHLVSIQAFAEFKRPRILLLYSHFRLYSSPLVKLAAVGCLSLFIFILFLFIYLQPLLCLSHSSFFSSFTSDRNVGLFQT